MIPKPAAAQRAEYLRQTVLSASPARLLTMLYDRLLIDLARAEAAQQAQEWAAASEHLLHAQDILTELLSTLKVDAWEGAKNLQALYVFSLSTLLEANIGRRADLTRQCISLLEPLQQAWQEAVDVQPAATAREPAAQPPGAEQPVAAALNPRSGRILGVG